MKVFFTTKKIYAVLETCLNSHNIFSFRCLAFGAAAAAGLGSYGLSFCTECYYKPGACGSVHQGTPLPPSPPQHHPAQSGLGLSGTLMRGDTSPPLSLLPSQVVGQIGRPSLAGSPAFQMSGGVKG